MEITIHNVETGEIITRPMTDEESLQWQADQTRGLAELEAFKAKEKARQELLERLGITQEEVNLLLG